MLRSIFCRSTLGIISLALHMDVVAAADTPSSELPRYRLKVGQELTYRSNDVFVHTTKSGPIRRR